MQYLFYILLVPFIFINYKIIISDYKEKKIPNSFLGYLILLIPFYYLYYYTNNNFSNLYLFIFQILLALFISFILYYYWIWAAWDAKYLLILSIFLPNIWIITIIWNLALITIIYLLLYFFRFYLIKIPLNLWYTKSLIINIKGDLYEKWTTYKNNNWWKNIVLILKWLIIFLTIFVSIRIWRLYFLNSFIQQNDVYTEYIKNLFIKYDFFILFLTIFLFLWLILLIKNIYFIINHTLINRFNFNTKLFKNGLLILLFLSLLSFLIYEFLINPIEILNSLYKIFTIYIAIYLVIKILIYSYKITFWIAECEYADINNLVVWDIIDKPYLLKLFWNQDSLKKENGWIYWWNMVNYFKEFKNPVWIEDLEIIKKSFEIVNDSHKNNNESYQEIRQIKILKTFAFWPYILLWFLTTFFFWNKLFVYIFDKFLAILKGIIS